MQVVTTVGLDIAKSVFQVHGVDAAGQVVIRRQPKQSHARFLHFMYFCFPVRFSSTQCRCNRMASAHCPPTLS
jgi:hypothetical protein